MFACQKSRSSGKGRGFGFVRFKTEWDTNRAIQRLNGRILCGRKIGVQIAKVINRDIKYSRASEAGMRFASVAVNPGNGRDYSVLHRNVKGGDKKENIQVWIEEMGGLKVVKIADSLAVSLKQAVCESYVVTVSNLYVSVSNIQDWFFSKVGIQVVVKRLSCYLLWIKPISQEGFSKLSKMESLVNDCLVRQLDQWTEVLGPALHPVWVRLRGIPLHAWDEKVFHRLGECLGMVMEIDKEAVCQQRVDRVRVLILRDPQQSIIQKIALEVEDVRFFVSVAVEDDYRCSGKINWPAASIKGVWTVGKSRTFECRDGSEVFVRNSSKSRFSNSKSNH
eukprot:TRINITY_DN7477_c1_g1_i5.p1 TRINITY_DN7477_c1_g1~~TRINITY_DN7477_c1_g1_i5.p1  ORF type:complete len:335 (-),score=59.40 TRINITY_DN7477_c1_g1_i5:653-1657(-)